MQHHRRAGRSRAAARREDGGGSTPPRRRRSRRGCEAEDGGRRGADRPSEQRDVRDGNADAGEGWDNVRCGAAGCCCATRWCGRRTKRLANRPRTVARYKEAAAVTRERPRYDLAAAGGSGEGGDGGANEGSSGATVVQEAMARTTTAASAQQKKRRRLKNGNAR
ncbi:hypothetical protein Syun_012227 [Stephania yunnanensis]|uniref:Uncharacterized protein n=1 Tax=Stephania yunnanensis TaxID=152371 RepID=A0AAP0JZ68_9MAGN